MNQKGFAPILIVIIIAALVGGYLLYQNQSKPTPPPQQTQVVQQISTPTPTTPYIQPINCKNQGSNLVLPPFKIGTYTTGQNGKKYYSYTPGAVNIKGHVIVIPVSLFGQETRGVFIKTQLSNQQNQEFYDYYMSLIEIGNGINKRDGTDLLFKLGELDKNGSFVTSAYLSSITKNNIESSINSGNNINLKLSITNQGEFGAGPDFSFACLIETP